MKKTILILAIAAGLSACGMPEEEKTRIAQVACAQIKETRNMDAVLRVGFVNDAREKIGAAPFLEGDEEILRSVQWDECELMILDFAAYLANIEEEEAEAKRIAAEKAAEEERINAAAPEACEKLHGICRYWHENGQLELEINYVNGEREGLSRFWWSNGQLGEETNYVNGKEEGLSRRWHENGQLWSEGNLVNGGIEGWWRLWDENGQLAGEDCYRNGEEVDMSYCR
jgi:hypothetical protein